jgi:hypothetical protein
MEWEYGYHMGTIVAQPDRGIAKLYMAQLYRPSSYSPKLNVLERFWKS